jgi:hypothetical protein
MNVDKIKSHLKQFSPIFLPGPNGGLRVLERSARNLFDIGPDIGSRENEAIAKAGFILAAASSPVMQRQPSIRLSIHVRYEALNLDNLGPALVILADLLGPTTRTSISIHIDQAFADWPLIRSFARFLRDTLKRPREADIVLIAPFGEFHEIEMSPLLELGVRVKFAAGWTRSCGLGEHVSVDRTVLRQFSEYGFRACIEWYVHEHSIQAFEDEVEDLLVANCYSGFSLPLVSENPYYRFDSGFPALPGSLQYCRLLVDNYGRYPYYDDVFGPLAALASLIAGGGWHSELNIPAALNLIVGENGGVDVFRQTPARALAWTSLCNIVTTTMDVLRESFLHIVSITDEGKWAPYCRECNWRYTCGGLDEPAGISPLKKDIDPICDHRKVFLEHFAKLRAPDGVFRVAP